MRHFFVLILLLQNLTGISQKEFFRSAFPDTIRNPAVFFSSLRIKDDLLLFNADDYQLYALNKKDGHLLWSQQLGWKSNRAPYIVNGEVWASESEHAMIRLDSATGSRKNALTLSAIYSEPVVINGIAYFTGIMQGGCLFAYDLAGDSIRWQQFLAHGIAEQPYFFADKILANVEGYHWLEIGYDGIWKNKKCLTQGAELPEAPCCREFVKLTHDKLEWKEADSEKQLGPYATSLEMVCANKYTAILTEEILLLLGNRKKVMEKLELTNLLIEDSITTGLSKLLCANDSSVKFMYAGIYFEYDIAEKKITRRVNLQTWEPHQVLPDGNRLWLISARDGKLYGLELN